MDRNDQDRPQLGSAALALRAVGLVIWLFTASSHLGRGAWGAWVVAWLLYGAAFLGTTPQTMPRAAVVTLLLVQTVIALGLPHLGFHGYEGLLTAIVAAEAATVLPFRAACLYALVQLVALSVAVAPTHAWIDVVHISGASGTFAVFALVLAFVRMREQKARHELLALHDERVATQALLLEGTRATERLRIARDLHDSLGHRLAAMNLHLDLASRLTDGRAAEAVRVAHGESRGLLDDVRQAVATVRAEGSIDLTASLRALGAATSTPEIDVEATRQVRVRSAPVAHAIYRAAQEFVTNAIKHGRAQHVHLRLEEEGAFVVLHARDDGTGADRWTAGGGLTGMRERVAELGGTLDVRSEPGTGFSVRVRVPLKGRAP